VTQKALQHVNLQWRMLYLLMSGHIMVQLGEESRQDHQLLPELVRRHREHTLLQPSNPHLRTYMVTKAQLIALSKA
jgi:hypothetical protein